MVHDSLEGLTDKPNDKVMARTETVRTKSGIEYEFTRTTNDVNGNGRYIVHFLALGLKSHEATKATRRAGLKKYNGRAYGGGFIFQASGDLERQAEFFEELGLHREASFEERNQLKHDLNIVEIRGLESLFNEFYYDYLGSRGIPRIAKDYGFFWCDHSLCSEDVVNGTPLKFEGYEIAELAMRENGIPYIVLKEKDSEGETVAKYLVDFNPFNGQWYILGTDKSGNNFKK